MTSRVLVVEPDAGTRGLVLRVLRNAGCIAEDFESVRDARLLLDEQAFDAALVDELAASTTPLDEVRFLREVYPRVAVVCTGAVLSRDDLLELLRLGVADVLPKPFTPADLREAVLAAVARSDAGRVESIEFRAAMDQAASAIDRKDLLTARSSLVRASARAPLDAEVTAWLALCSELAGDDATATRGYRAAIDLADESDPAVDLARAGLARIERYEGAAAIAVMPSLDPGARHIALCDPTMPLELGGDETAVVAMSLALPVEHGSALYFRKKGRRAFVLVTGSWSTDRLRELLQRIGATSIEVVGDPTGIIDVDGLVADPLAARHHPNASANGAP